MFLWTGKEEEAAAAAAAQARNASVGASGGDTAQIHQPGVQKERQLQAIGLMAQAVARDMVRDSESAWGEVRSWILRCVCVSVCVYFLVIACVARVLCLLAPPAVWGQFVVSTVGHMVRARVCVLMRACCDAWRWEAGRCRIACC